jgi:hypothetical protein
MDVEGNGHDLVWGSTSVFPVAAEEKYENVMTAVTGANNQTGDLPNKE